MKQWYTAELCNDLADKLREWARKNGVSYETSACGTIEVPITHFELYMDEETCEVCQNFLDEI